MDHPRHLPPGRHPAGHRGWPPSQPVDSSEGIERGGSGSSGPPETRYARAGDINIAYQVVGDGPIDLVYIPSWVTNVEENWSEPGYARFLRRLASFARLIVFDKRGTGLSDRVTTTPTFEERIEDLQAVMTAVGSEQAVLFGSSEGSAMCALFAATWPERTRALIMYGAYARRVRSIDYPWGPDLRERQELYDIIETEWGGPAGMRLWAPSAINDERFCQWYASYLRRSASPGSALALAKLNSEIDIREILPAIKVPTLLLHRIDDSVSPIEGARYIAANIPGAAIVEVPGIDHMPFAGDIDALIDPVQEFLTGAPPAMEMDRVLTTILVIDIVDSTSRAIVLGDQRWRVLLEKFRAYARQELDRFRGIERNVTGDGLVATFDGPGRAIYCASAIARAARALDFEIRAGIHTGECALSGPELDGIAVHVAARTMTFAGAAEIVVTRTVRDLVMGSNVEFMDRDRHVLEGIPGIWHLFGVDARQ